MPRADYLDGHLLDHLHKLKEPCFSAAVLQHLCYQYPALRRAFIGWVGLAPGVPEPRQHNSFSATLRTLRECQQAGEQLMPLALQWDNIALHLGIVLGEPPTSLPHPTRHPQAGYVRNLYLRPAWRAEQLDSWLGQTEANIVTADLNSLATILRQTTPATEAGTLAHALIDYLEQRETLVHGHTLPTWLHEPMEDGASPDHWRVLEKLHHCFPAPDKVTLCAPDTVGFCFGKQTRGWFGFHTAHGVAPSQRATGLYLVLPQEQEQTHPNLLPATPGGLLKTVAGDRKAHCFELAYDPDWVTLEPWLGTLDPIIEGFVL